MTLSNIGRRLSNAEKAPEEGFHYLTREEVETAIARAEAGLDPGLEYWHVQATITNLISRLHTEEDHGEEIWWQQCPRCQKRLNRR